MWMNEYDIDSAVRRFDTEETPNLAEGARSLYALMVWTNNNSDGWPYWVKPARAAKRLMVMLDTARREYPASDVSAADLTAALRPVKAFLTRQGADSAVVLGREVAR